MPNFLINIRSKGAKKASNEVKGLTGNLNGMASAAKKAAIVFGVGFLGKQLFDIGKSAIKTAASFETLKVRLTALYGSVDRGTKAFDNFNKVAASTPFQLQDVVDAGASLKAFGLDAEEMIKPLADLAAFMQVDMSVAASNMGRAFVAGAGAADMFREKGINQMIADMAGVMDATKLPIEQYRATLQKVLIDPNSGIAGMTTKMADTWNGAVSNFQDGIDRLKAAIGDQLIKFLRPKLDAINVELSKMGEIGWDNIAKTFLDNSGEVLTAVGKLFASGGEIIGLKFVDAIGDAIESFLPNLRTFQALLLPIMPQFALGLKQSSIEFENHDAKIQELTTSMKTLVFEGYDAFLKKSGELNEAESESELNLGEALEFKKAMQDINLAQLEKTSEAELSASEAQAKAIKDREANENKFFKSKSKWQRIVLESELRNTALTSQSAGDAMKSVVKAETMEAVAGLIASILKGVPYPFNLILAAGAGGMASRAIDTELAKVKFAEGGSFVTSGPQAIIVGDNPGGREAVNITPLSSPPGPDAPGGSNITLNISAPLVDETVVDSIIPSIREAIRRGESLGIS